MHFLLLQTSNLISIGIYIRAIQIPNERRKEVNMVSIFRMLRLWRWNVEGGGHAVYNMTSDV